jgi:hypothetical protein
MRDYSGKLDSSQYEKFNLFNLEQENMELQRAQKPISMTF